MTHERTPAEHAHDFGEWSTTAVLNADKSVRYRYQVRACKHCDHWERRTPASPEWDKIIRARETDERTPAEQKCGKCYGTGWLWGRELENADGDTQADTQTKYPCDACTPAEAEPQHDTDIHGKRGLPAPNLAAMNQKSDPALLAALKQKAEPQAGEEPVAWMYECNDTKIANYERWLGYDEPLIGWTESPLYSAAYVARLLSENARLAAVVEAADYLRSQYMAMWEDEFAGTPFSVDDYDRARAATSTPKEGA